MNKIWVIAAREYRAAVRTKSFLISLLLMPVLMSGSVAVQVIMKKQGDTKDKPFAIVDRTPGQKVFPLLEQAAAKRNQEITEGVKQTRPRFVLTRIDPGSETPEAVAQQRLELSEDVRHEKYWGFVEIGPAATRRRLPGSPPLPADRFYLRYQTNHPTFEEFPSWVQRQVILAATSIQIDIPPEEIANWQELILRREGLSQRDPATGEIVDPPVIQVVARFIVPGALVALMFMIVMLSSTPGMQGVVEEKMQRIAEVLLGSLPPFQLMLGKLLGLMGVSLTIAAVYLGGAYWAAHKYGFAEFLSMPVLLWFIVFQMLSVLMFGSLFLAIGAAATDIKETQTLVMPVMLIACLPMFLLSTALEDPNNPLVVGASFFPPSTPMLMMARVAISPGPPLWQLILAVLLVVAVTLSCVYAAGRIFRVGILMQGKGAKFSQLLQWVFRG